jgi:plastocyanin
MKKIGVIAAVAACVIAAAPGGRATAYEAVDVKDGGTIVGEVTVDGNVSVKKVQVTKDQEVCGKEKDPQDLLVTADKKLVNAVVSIGDIQKGKKIEAPAASLDQKGCEYKPHVVFVTPGNDLKILNSDGILHNIHTYSKKNPPVNIAQPKFKKEVSAKFAQPEVVDVKCDAHGWMHGTIVVLDHPYYTATDDKGSFKLTDVPPGEYTVKVWHAKLGEASEKVKVEAGKEAKVAFKLTAK